MHVFALSLQFGNKMQRQQARISKNEMRKLMYYRRLELEISDKSHALDEEWTLNSIQVRQVESGVRCVGVKLNK